jgi:transposase
LGLPAEHHLIVAHQVTNQVVDRGQLPAMAVKAKEALSFETIEAIADVGYYRGADLLACKDIGVTALAPRTNTSTAKAEGRFSKEAFTYLPDEDAYRCPAGERLTYRYNAKEADLTTRMYWCSTCRVCPMKDKCTPGTERRVRRWEHENIVEAMVARRKQSAQWPSGARRSSIHSRPSRPGWEQLTSCAKA